MNVLVDSEAHPVIAHRGNSRHVPENTLHAFDEAVALAVDAIELDVRLTRDGMAAVVHDAAADRTTNGSGPIAAFSMTELAALDAGFRFTRDHGESFPWRERGHTIPSLDDVLGRYAELPVLIEVKEPQVLQATCDVVRRHGAEKRVVLASSLERSITPIRGAFLTGATSPETVRLMWAALLGRPMTALPFECLSIPRWYRGIPVPVHRIARAIRPLGISTHVWTVDSPTLARSLWRGDINGLVTNDPGALLPVRLDLFGGVHDRRRQ